MKRVILIFAAVAFMINIGNAQENMTDLREKLTFGVKVGTNLSNVYDSKDEKFKADAKFGLATGVFVAIPIGKYLGIQPEVLFSQKGFKATGTLLGSDYSMTRTTDYIDVPLLIAFKPIGRLTLLAGPQYSYLLKQKDVFENSAATIEQQKEFNNDNIRKNMLCFTGGFDVNLNNLVIGARAGWDLKENNGDGTSTTPRYKNVWYQATIGYRF